MSIPQLAAPEAPQLTAPEAALPAARERLLTRVEDRIRQVIDAERARWRAVDVRGQVPVDAVAALVEAGGKRIRPTFCLTGYLAGDGDPGNELIVDAAAALEFLHAFALLHDDVMDDAALRRGATTAHVRHAAEHTARGWRGEARRYGESVAMLAGDLAHSYASQLAAGLPPTARADWENLINEMIVGQFLDMAVAAESLVDADLTRWIALGKSGRYTIHGPLVLGASVAGRPDLTATLQGYGTALGEAFQLRDDLIDAYGDVRAAGKPTGHDLDQHKMTLLLVLAAARDTRVRAMVTDGNWDAARLRALLDECEVRAEVEHRIDRLVGAAQAAIQQADISPQWRAELSRLALAVAYRDR